MGRRTGLLCVCFALQLMGAQASKDREEEAGSADFLSRRQYEHLQKQLGAVRDVSHRYWHSLACQLWQEGCEEEEEGSRGILGQHDWKLPMVTELVSTWYCGFGRCCPTGDCRVVNNITGLELVLSKRLHGQHLAKKIVLKAIRGFLEKRQPEKALTLSFNGWSGTGKSFVARLMAEHLYRDGLKSDCVKIFISVLHFPHLNYIDLYKVELTKQITETVRLCEQSLFIFDEAEKLHPVLLNALEPYVGHNGNTDEVDYRQSIFLFLSETGFLVDFACQKIPKGDHMNPGHCNHRKYMPMVKCPNVDPVGDVQQFNTGGNIINKVALDFWQAGQAREEITMEYLEQLLRRDLLDAPDAHNFLLQKNLIDFLVPFLPLEYHHVKLCARDAFLARDLQFTEEMLDEVARTIFAPKGKTLFSAQGCKSVSQRIN